MIRVTELDLYNVCHGTYEDDYPFDLIFQGDKDAETYVGIKRFGDLDVVAFRGSTTLLDWLRNFECLPTYEKEEGWVDSGFHVGLDEVRVNLSTVIGPNWIGVGHSRGAAQVTDFACDMVIAGRPPLALMPLAPPRTALSGGQKRILANIPTRWYRNIAAPADPVTEVPPWCGHPYISTCIEFRIAAPVGDPWGPLASHHSELYGQFIASLNPMPVYTVPEPVGA